MTTIETSNYETMRETIKQKQATLKAEMQAIGEAYFKDSIKRLFTDYPDLTSFSWTQYTPYFNDGDECVFGAHTSYPDVILKSDLTSFEGDEYDWEELRRDEAFNVWKPGKDREPKDERERVGFAIIDVLDGVDNDIYKMLFGDHCRVTVTAEGVDVEEYEHD